MKKMIAAIALLGSLVACGGGGGDSGPPPIAVAVSPTTAQASSVAGTTPDGMVVVLTATLSATPTTTVYPMIVSSSAAIRTGTTDAIQTGANTWTVRLYSVPTLAVGTYSGTVSLKLCKDMQCSSEYPVTGASVPFTFTVVSMPSFTLTTNGTTTTVDPMAGFQLDVANNANFTLTSNAPVTWTTQDVDASIQQQATTSTTISGQAVKTPGISGGMVMIFAAPVAVPDYSLRFDLLPQ